MTVFGVGVDVVDLTRFQQTLERTPGVRDRLFTPAEAELPLESLAARFAAKEALMKALKVPSALPWREIEVVSDEVGAPVFSLRGSAAERINELKARVHLSLSHDVSVATAFVVVEC